MCSVTTKGIKFTKVHNYKITPQLQVVELGKDF